MVDLIQVEQTTPKATISLCMIVKNEENVLARCLDSVKDAVDEIIIVDTGSTDLTKEIALKYTEKVYDFEWINDFAAARNFAFSKATMDYQMWLDADDVLSEEMLGKLIELKNLLTPTIDIVIMKYITLFDENNNPLHYSTRERLIRREKNYQWNGVVHECIAIVGNVIYSDIEIHHRKIDIKESNRNLKIYEALETKGPITDPRSQYYFARELVEHGVLPRAAYYFEIFLEEAKGWVEDNIAACFHLATIYHALGREQKVLPILLKSLEYAPPRAEICCEIGFFYKRAQNYKAALEWFLIATKLGKPDSLGFVVMDYWGYIPNIECCVCYAQFGDRENAKKYNDAAAVFKPDSPAVLQNREILG